MKGRIEILTTGEELTIGEIVDGNAAWLGAELFAKGLSVSRITTVGDELEEIVDTLREAAARASHVIVSGGLGPTLDDRTVEAVCLAFDRIPTQDEGHLARIQQRFAEMGRVFTKNNEKQALIPSGATLLPDGIGTAAAFVLEVEGCRIFCLPGVPGELRHLARRHLFVEFDALLAAEGIFRRSATIHCVGIPESHLDQVARDVLPTDEPVRFGIRTHFPENQLRLMTEGRSEAEAISRCETWERRLRDALGPAAYGGAGDTFPAVTLAALRARGWRVVLAESLTAGRAASLLADAPGASEVLVGASVVYAEALKRDWLGVREETLQGPGPVSEACARELAEGALARSAADLAVSLTGWAGPDPGADGQPAGTVYAGLAQRGAPTQVLARRLTYGRRMVREGAAYLALDLLRRRALDLPLP